MTTRIVLATAVILALLAGNAWLHHALLTSRAPIIVWDFHPRWTAVREMFHRGANPYSDEVTETIQRQMLGHRVQAGSDQNAFAYPLHVVALIGPLTLLPLPVAQAVWFSLLEASLLALTVVAPRAVGWRPSTWLLGLTALFTVFFYSTVWAVILGQVAILVTAFIALAWLSLRGSRWALTGILLALATVKPQLSFLFVPGVLLWAALSRHWRLILAFAGALTLLCLLPSLWIPTWPAAWLQAVADYNSYTPFDPPLVGLTGAYWPTLVVAGVLLVWVARSWRSVPRPHEPIFHWGLSMLLVVGALTAPRSSHVNHLVLLLPLFVVMKQTSSRGLIVGIELALLAVPWLMDMLLAPPLGTMEHTLWQHRYIAPILPLGLTVALVALGARLRPNS